jgi:hypothetical protein
MKSGILQNWLLRHQHPASQILHAVGIPLLVAGLLLGAWQLAHLQWSLWWRPVGLILISYILQGIGHKIEGNDMGELILIKKWLGKPYTAIAPQYDRVSAEADR